ncbi:hypothetical protein ABKN59_004917 [Abortiporus biennis]
MSDPSTSGLPVLHLDGTLGAIFIGLVIATLFTGIGCLQTFLYFMGIGKKDHIILRIMVACLWIFDILEIILGTMLIYRYVITNYANPFTLPIIFWNLPAYLILGGISDFFVRCIFIYRIWILSSTWLIQIALMIMNCVVLAFGLLISEKFKQLGNFLELDQIKWQFMIEFTLIAVVDTLIALILCHLLWKRKTHVTSRRISSQINTLMIYTIQTGAFTSLFSIAVLVTYSTMSANLVYAAIYAVVPKIYHNALLASLNGRESLRAGCDTSTNKGYNSAINFASTIPSSSVDPNDIEAKRIISIGSIHPFQNEHINPMSLPSPEDTSAESVTQTNKQTPL